MWKSKEISYEKITENISGPLISFTILKSIINKKTLALVTNNYTTELPLNLFSPQKSDILQILWDISTHFIGRRIKKLEQVVLK